MKQLVSIVIPTQDRETQLLRLLDSIKDSIYKNIEIIIVNNSTNKVSHNLLNKINKEFTEINLQIIENKKNLGLAKARNIGASFSNGEFVLFIDDDNILDKDCIANLLKTLKDNKNYLAVGPLTYYFSKKDLIWFCTVSYNFYTSRFIFNNFLNKQNLVNQRYLKTDNLHNCFMVRKELGDLNSWFDDEVFLGGTEFDFFMKIKRKYKGVLVTDIESICYHDIPHESKNNQLRALGITSPLRIYYFQKNRGLIISRYGNFFHKLSLIFIFYPLFFLFYSLIFLKNKRYDLLSRNLNGTIDGYKYLLLSKF